MTLLTAHGATPQPTQPINRVHQVPMSATAM